MKKQKLCASVLVFSLCVGLVPVSGTGTAEAAKADVRLSKTSMKLTISTKDGKTTYGAAELKVKAAKGVKVKKVTYKSANSKAATVDKKGKVKAKSEGSAKVKVTVKYTKKKKSLKKTLTCKVTVKKIAGSTAPVAVPTAGAPVPTAPGQGAETKVSPVPTAPGQGNGTGENQTPAPTGSEGETQTPAPTGSTGENQTPAPTDSIEQTPTPEPTKTPSPEEIQERWDELIDNGIIAVKDGVVKGCNKQYEGELFIPEGVTSIESSAFYGCKGLTSITIPGSVMRIEYSAFCNCSSLTRVVILEGVTSIEDCAFAGCVSLTSVTIPDSVMSIRDSAFSWCIGLTSITIPGSVTSIEDYAFDSCSGLTSIKVDEKNTKYDSRDNCNAIIKKDNNELILGCQNTIIPKGVRSIGRWAFYGCSGLTSITIPEGVTSIGRGAFCGCSGLASIIIPDSVTIIEDGDEGTFTSVPLVIYDGNSIGGCPWGAKKVQRSDGTVLYPSGS